MSDSRDTRKPQAVGYVRHYGGERKQDRRTPLDFFKRLDAKYGFTMDGAATKANCLVARFSSKEFERPWVNERVFCNPPWGNIPPFIELAPEADLAVLLVPARTNCGWFHRALELGAKPDYWKGKLNFSGKWNSPVDCLLLIFEARRRKGGS